MIKTAVLVGCGAMAKSWVEAITDVPYLSTKIKIVGLVDLSLDTAQALANQFHLSQAKIGTDLEEILQLIQPDLVLDVAIPAARYKIVSLALQQGCHVISEKPMANNLTEAHQLIKLASKQGKIHSIIQNRRYNSGIRRINELVTSGALGTLTSVHCDFFIGAHFGGFRDEMEHVLLHDMAIHTFDAARFIINKKPLNVYCQESNPVGSWYKHGAAANAIFEFEENCIFTYRGSWCAEGMNTSWESEWRVIGTKGTLTWDGLDTLQANIISGSEGFFRETQSLKITDVEDNRKTQGHISVLSDFIDAINNGTEPETINKDNINSLAMVFAAIESAESNLRINIKSEV
ncbi:Gfo/Idh/MocA family protein [Marinomonas polaris]|uniref:Gfo/Idh/MocA family protein n=1 Tax=Marinomonas polaris TaxID=293552 RepID=UPI003F947658